MKVVCYLDILVQQLGGSCKYPGCIFETVADYTLCGTSAMIRWSHWKILHFRGGGQCHVKQLSSCFQPVAWQQLCKSRKVCQFLGAFIYLSNIL